MKSNTCAYIKSCQIKYIHKNCIACSFLTNPFPVSKTSASLIPNELEQNQITITKHEPCINMAGQNGSGGVRKSQRTVFLEVPSGISIPDWHIQFTMKADLHNRSNTFCRNRSPLQRCLAIHSQRIDKRPQKSK